MKTIVELAAAEWTIALGWTLLHSLWQALAILLVVHLALRIVPLAKARVRYALATGGLFLFLVLAIATFVYLYHSAPSGSDSVRPFAAAQSAVVVARADGSAVGWWAVVRAFLEMNMPVVLIVWAAGFMLSLVRLASGLWYTSQLRASAVPVGGDWSYYIERTRASMGIRRLVTLAESAAVRAPLVIGYLKPLILVPMGVLSGLPANQIETILTHELAHIRRHDYLVNLIQAFAEALFFFNPFTWMLSVLIRRERECCCDDLVVVQHGSAKAYAHALARLAEWRLEPQAFALSLASDKHQLLYRIRRIMEHSMKSYSSKGKILLPATLLLIAFLCVSWLGVRSQDGQKEEHALAKQDTVKKKSEKSATYTRKSIITLDENGQPHEEVIEEFEGDEDLRSMMQDQFPKAPGFPPFAPGLRPPVPSAPNIPVPDSLPANNAFPFDGGEWEAFSRAFGEDFAENFRDLRAFREEALADMMRGFEERFQSEDWMRPFSFQMPDEAFRGFPGLGDSTMFEELREQMEALRDLNMNHMRHLPRHDPGEQLSLRDFEEILRDELVKDGYLSKGEDIESLSWSDETFRVNGKEVKKADQEKYRTLRRKYLEENRGRGRFE